MDYNFLNQLNLKTKSPGRIAQLVGVLLDALGLQVWSLVGAHARSNQWMRGWVGQQITASLCLSHSHKSISFKKLRHTGDIRIREGIYMINFCLNISKFKEQFGSRYFSSPKWVYTLQFFSPFIIFTVPMMKIVQAYREITSYMS